MNIPQTIVRYWLAMNASAVQSATHTTKTFIATATAHALQNNIPALNLPQAAAVFGLAFALEIFNWLDTHPLTDLIPPDAAPAATQPSTPRNEP